MCLFKPHEKYTLGKKKKKPRQKSPNIKTKKPYKKQHTKSSQMMVST